MKSGAIPDRDHALIEVRDLVKYFPIRRGAFGRRSGLVHAVDGISFDLPRAGSLGLVGESGCSNTTAGRTNQRLLPHTSGRVLLEGRDVFALTGRELLRFRRRCQLIFQDPYGSLNPRMTVGAIVGEGLHIHGIEGAEGSAPAGRTARRRAVAERVAELLEQVGLRAEHARRYPHEFSGGQRQRITIARALALEPSFIVCDEPVSALDVSVQAQVLNLLADLQEARGISYLLIAHDLAVVRQMCPSVAVMYLGQIVEQGPSSAVYEEPRHPYTQALLSAVPQVSPATSSKRIVLEGDPPSPADPPAGCRFHPRCPAAASDPSLMARCRSREPPVYDLGGGHTCKCFLAESG